MRDRIVNKLYCRPLPQKPKVAAIIPSLPLVSIPPVPSPESV